MKIMNFAENEIVSEITGVRSYRDGAVEDFSFAIAEEHLMKVYINGILTMKVVCTPSDLAELVLGRLYSEGMITGLEDVKSISICEYGTIAQVKLQKEAAISSDDFVEITPTCCTNNHLLNDMFLDKKPPAPVSAIEWKPEWILKMAERFEQSTPLYDATKSIHSCYLGMKDEILFCCEDLGRHNAVDKVIGKALIQGIDLGKCMVFTSGRIPTDMVIKIIRAGIPILATKTTVTKQAVLLAREFNLTMMVYAKNNHFTVISP